MAEIVISIVTSVLSKIGELLVEPTIRKGRYLFCGAKVTKNSEAAKEELVKTQNEIQKRVEELPEVEKADGAVVKWLDDVKNLITEVEKLEEEIKAKGSCFRGCCLYGLYKQMAQKTETLINLNIDSKFDPFSNPAPLPDIDYYSSGKFMKFKSTMLALDQLLKALGDGNSCVIGLFGMGGSGKTTLAVEVGKEAKNLKLFDRVVLTTVSQAPTDVRRIQEEIGGLLDLKFKNNEGEAVRARKISMRLQSKERILVILDDVWGKLNLEEIGVPVDAKHNRFKILLTTRRLEVCTLMGCQKEIPLQLLSEDEAWTLFKKHAGLDDKHLKLLNGKAQKVARECKGLHIAIEAVGTSLKGKPIDDWVVALNRLEHSEPIDVEDGVRDAFTCLKLSYDYLRSKEAKLLFLMCSMFPEDHDISIEDLFRYGIGLGVCREVNSFEIARSEVKKYINYLINSCLLMRSENKKDCVKMHDMVRDVALWISSKEDRTIIVNHPKGLNSLSEATSTQDCFAIVSWHEEIAQFPQQLDAPKLEILLLHSKHHLDPSYASFEGIKGLKVMVVIKNNYSLPSMVTLPQSMQWLTNLCIMQLVKLELGDISFVLSLKALEILDLESSKFRGLPCGLEQLNKLKLLDLTNCRSDENCYEVLRRCSQLEEIYVNPSYFSSSFKIIDFEAFYVDNVTFPKLQRYIFKVGNFCKNEKFISSSKRALYIMKLNISTSGATIKNLIQRATEVFLERLVGCKSVIPEMVEAVGGMNELIGLDLDSCSEMECLFSTTSSKAKSFEEDTSLSNLVRLRLNNMNNLIEFCHGPPLLCIFQNLENVNISNCNQLQSLFPGECNLCNLKYLSIERCPKLTRLFSMSVAHTLLLLQELSIVHCSALEHIMTDGEGGSNGGHKISENSHLGFSQLKKLHVDDCHELEYIFPISMVQSLAQLEEMRITYSAALRYIFGKHNGQYCSSYENEMLPQLKRIELKHLWNLVRIVREGYKLSCPSLMHFSCEHCPKLTRPWSITDIVGSEERHLRLNTALTDGHVSQEILDLQAILNVKMQFAANKEQGLIMVANLKELFLKGLHNLVFIWNHSTLISFQLLQTLKVDHCKNLRSIFSVTVIRSLPLLEILHIRNCEDLEEIISVGEGEEPYLPNPSNSRPQQPCFPKLYDLRVERCDKLKRVFPISISGDLPCLGELYISNCFKLEQVFGCVPKNHDAEMMDLALQNLQKLTLHGLPRLTNICRGFDSQLQLEALHSNDIRVIDCPDFDSTSILAIYESGWQQRFIQID